MMTAKPNIGTTKKKKYHGSPGAKSQCSKGGDGQIALAE
jgi:hypothetical protein